MVSPKCNIFNFLTFNQFKKIHFKCMMWAWAWTAQPIGCTPALFVTQKRHCSCKYALFWCYIFPCLCALHLLLVMHCWALPPKMRRCRWSEDLGRGFCHINHCIFRATESPRVYVSVDAINTAYCRLQNSQPKKTDHSDSADTDMFLVRQTFTSFHGTTF